MLAPTRSTARITASSSSRMRCWESRLRSVCPFAPLRAPRNLGPHRKTEGHAQHEGEAQQQCHDLVALFPALLHRGASPVLISAHRPSDLVLPGRSAAYERAGMADASVYQPRPANRSSCAIWATWIPRIASPMPRETRASTSGSL